MAELFNRETRKSLALAILGATKVKHASIASALGVSAGHLSKWGKSGYAEAPPDSDAVFALDRLAQTSIARDALNAEYGPCASEQTHRVLRIIAQLTDALESGDADYLDHVERAMRREGSE